MQMVQTSASLMVNSGSSEEDFSDPTKSSSEQVEYIAKDDEQNLSRRAGLRKRNRKPLIGMGTAATIENQEEKPTYWPGLVDNEDKGSLSARVTKEEDFSTLQPNLRKRKQPAVREPLAALEKEQKLFELRDKQRQQFVASEAIGNKAYRIPFSQSKKEQNESSQLISTNQPNANSKGTIALKNILKNSGGLSLSEILQQKNLSLDDLIKGKQNALLALQTTATSSPNSSFLEKKDTTLSDSPENAIRNKLKFPTLNRSKLFGNASRPTNTQNNTAAKGPTSSVPISNSTSTTPKPTTRLPLYKKRQQMRSTLKPSALLQNTTSSNYQMTTTKDETTTFETTTEYDKIQSNTQYIISDEFSSTDFRELKNLTSTTEKNYISSTSSTNTEITPSYKRSQSTSRRTSSERYSTMRLSINSTAPSPSTSTSKTQTTKSTLSPIKITTGSNFRKTNNYQGNLKLRNNIRNKNEENTLKNNSIEQDELKTPSFSPATVKENAINREDSNDDDDLENFEFEGAESKAIPSSTVSNITPIIKETYAMKSRKKFNPTIIDDSEDRTDLLELLEDRRSGTRLFKVLEQRNMTLEELIAHRKRGSSQLHLSTIVKDHSRFFPDKKIILHDNLDIVTAFENFPHFNLMNLKSINPDEIKTDSEGSSYFTSIIDIEPTDESSKEQDINGSGNDGKDLLFHPSEKPTGFYPSWQSLALAPLAKAKLNSNRMQTKPHFFVQQPKLLLDSSESKEQSTNNEEDNNDAYKDSESDNENDNDNINNYIDNDNVYHTIKTSKPEMHTSNIIESDLARGHDLVELELSGHGFKRSPSAISLYGNRNFYSNLPYGIKSAIVASAAIILTTLLTFMVIFIVYRWKQKQKNRLTYVQAYNSMKNKLPNILAKSKKSAASSSTDNINDIINSIATIETTPSHLNLQKQSSLLFPRSSLREADFKTDHLSTSLNFTKTNQIINNTEGNYKNGTATAHSYGCDYVNSHGHKGCNDANIIGFSNGLGSRAGSTTSLALSLRSISSTKINTMDTNAPALQEYLFDNLRKSYEN